MSERAATTRWLSDARIDTLPRGRALWRPRLERSGDPVVAPGEDAEGRVSIGFHALVLRFDDVRAVVDPGLDDAESPWGRAFADAWTDVERTDPIDEALLALGLRAVDVTHVILTHAHVDHVAATIRSNGDEGSPRFPRAVHYLGAGDRERSRYDGVPSPEVIERLRVLERHGLLSLCAGEREIVSGLTLLPAPGESPGHQVVRLRRDGAVFYALGDLFHLPCEVEHPSLMPRGRDAGALVASRAAICGAAAEAKALCHMPHGLPSPWGSITASPDGWRWSAS